jgi:hypothetical protein
MDVDAMPSLPISSEQCQQLLALLRSKCPNDASLSAPVTTDDNQDHLFGDMVGNIHPSFCLQTFALGDKHYVFSSDHLFQKAIQNSVNCPWIIDLVLQTIWSFHCHSLQQLHLLFLEKSSCQMEVLLKLLTLAPSKLMLP